MVLFFTSLDALNHLPGVCSSVDDSHIDGYAVNFQTGFPQTLVAADGLQIQKGFRGLLPGDIGISGAQRSLHHAAGIAENDTGAGSFAHQAVVGTVFQTFQIDTGFLGPLGKLTGCDNEIHIPHFGNAQLLACCIHFLASDLKLLGSAGGQSDIDNLSRIDAHFLRKVGLDSGALHTDRALGSGDMG